MKHLTIAMLLFLLLGACTQQAPVIKKLDQQNAKVGIMATEWPKSVEPSSEFSVMALVRNVGEQTLPSSGGAIGAPLQVNVTYHWLSLQGNPLVWDGIRTPIGGALKKSAARDLKLRVRAPPRPGRYVLEVDVVQEGEFWFGGVGSQTARMTIDVK